MINHTSHTYLHHVFVANTCTLLTATAYWLFTVVDLVSITETEELSDLTAAEYIVYIALDMLLQLCRTGAEK